VVRTIAPILCLLLLAAPLPAQRAESSPDAALQAVTLQGKLLPISPTVTAEMGDLGGKSFGVVPDPAKTRHYYIAAELDTWDCAKRH
jgi:hypothetical protein